MIFVRDIERLLSKGFKCIRFCIIFIETVIFFFILFLNVFLICFFWIFERDFIVGDGGIILLVKVDVFDGDLEFVVVFDKEGVVFGGGLYVFVC